ncbi:DUF6503 family protein [Rubrivirga sp. S365]|uniref:DUF6503 family protein n=1 Tax=Rubrivirga litoralis TaxID=3075598 RepID=A0ABU3BR40_9BACT|nr:MULTISPECIES: DUF6503 family protein [unclassified Rubrivirga]MDT0631734.1 DUF6503 family protein [Rubrivirga sp. F394]MDT7856102.1 DUF6503 family protein [Rubrivirga sp. S365]
MSPPRPARRGRGGRSAPPDSVRRPARWSWAGWAVAAVVALAACAEPPRPQGDAEALALLDRARAVHGSAALDRADVRFEFRGTPFTLRRDGGAFRYARTLTDSLGRTVEEAVDNEGAHRTVGGAAVPLDSAEAARLATAVNSVAYFALLPAPLADPAVRARSLGPGRVGGEAFDRVGVTFAQDGGGADWDDRYVYWLRPDGRVAYYAYTYAADPADTSRAETGTRFRALDGERRVDGVLFQDWRNLTADSVSAIEDYGDIHDAGRTFEVSRVALDSVRVQTR